MVWFKTHRAGRVVETSVLVCALLPSYLRWLTRRDLQGFGDYGPKRQLHTWSAVRDARRRVGGPSRWGVHVLMSSHSCDLDLLAEVDDAYWINPYPELAFKQPEEKPSMVAFAN